MHQVSILKILEIEYTEVTLSIKLDFGMER
jgi:hypothetical protein